MGHASCETRQKLIDTAVALIWKSSYGSVSVDDICKAADVKKGSFYHFFPSKVDLAIAAMDSTTADWKALHDEAFSAGRDPLERLERYADVLYEKQAEAFAEYGQVCGCSLACLAAEMAPQEERIRQKFEEITNHKRRYFEGTFRDMVADGSLPAETDVKAKTEEVMSYIIGQLMVARIQNTLEPLKRDLKQGLLSLTGAKRKTPKAA